MMVVGFGYFAWIAFCPLNLLFGYPPGGMPVDNIPLLIIDSILYIPVIYTLVKRWFKTMLKRQSGPASGIDTVESGPATPEPGDEWGRATRPYTGDIETKITGSKSDLRDAALAIDSAFFIKLPNLDTGETLFESEELHKKAMIRSRVSSGSWSDKRVSSRAVGSLKAMESNKTGRPTRWQQPVGEISSIHLPSTIIAAISRIGKIPKGERIRIEPEDIRESVYSGKTPMTIILVVDVSLSMKGSLSDVRKLIEQIERETRGSKDRVGIVAFKDSGAIEVQAPTTNWNKIYRALARLKISGLTPLAEGLMKSLEAIKRERMRNPDIEPLVIVISDFAPNIPLAQSVGPGHAQYTPIKDLVKASRLLRKQNVRLAAVDVEKEHRKWSRALRRPFHDALELAAMLRMKKEGHSDIIETILYVNEFRQHFGALLIAKTSGGRAFLAEELVGQRSILSTILNTVRSKAKLDAKTLKAAESYLP
ncbi:MAG: VWA domain-containing protein [Candidatus Thorarchaeota archaeon]